MRREPKTFSRGREENDGADRRRAPATLPRDEAVARGSVHGGAGSDLRVGDGTGSRRDRIGYTLSQVVGSAFAPTIAVALYNATGTSLSIAGYLVGVSVLSVIAAALLPGPWKGNRER